MEEAEEVKAEAPEVRRSPFTYEVVEPTEGDQRNTPKNVAARVEGRRQHSNCGSGQLFDNNPMSEEPVTYAWQNDPDGLYNDADRPANFAVIHEKPEHRLIVYLKSQGLSNNEIATRTGYSPAWVSQITRQPWFRLRLVQELKAAGIDAVQTAIKGSALDSVFTLVDIRDDPTAPKAVRKACCDSLLDRFLGKPKQPLEHDVPALPSSTEISALTRQIDEIDEQLKGELSGKV